MKWTATIHHKNGRVQFPFEIDIDKLAAALKGNKLSPDVNQIILQRVG